MSLGFQVRQIAENLTPVAGLSLVGHYLQRLEPIFKQIDRAVPVSPTGITTSRIIRAYVGLLAQGKSDFDAIEAFRGDPFFSHALDVSQVPSSPTLRQRLDSHATELFDFIPVAIEELLRIAQPDYGLLPCGWLPCDIDTFAMDNGGTAKEGVSRTYAGVDGYCPIAVYLGSHGYCLELALRPGRQHSAYETQYNLERVLPMAQRLSAAGPKAPILVRKDSGFDSADLMREIDAANTAPGLPHVDFLIKWNPRKTDVQAIANRLDADPTTAWQHPRVGKRIAIWEESFAVDGIDRPLRRVLRLIERTIDKHGQHLLVPDLVLEGWSTTLPVERFDSQAIIALYADHGTHEQFHSEFKTDLDLERLPSGKFDTNYLVCQLAALTMNILRLIGQNTLLGPNAPVRHPAKRRRMKTVMQEIIYRAARVIRHAGQWVLGLAANDPATDVILQFHQSLQPSTA